MAVTNTTYHSLPKQDLGDANWHTELNNALDYIDGRLPRNYAGNPNGNVIGLYLGQLIYDSSNNVVYKCTLAGNAATATWTDVVQSAIPSGVIVMWSGNIATIPTNWVLCNGSNSTPDLRDKFIVGAKQDDSSVAKSNVTGSLLASGGTTSYTSAAGGDHDHGAATGSYTLLEADIPAHTHAAGTLAADSNGAHTHSYATGGVSSGGTLAGLTGGTSGSTNTGSNGAHTHTISGSTASTGGGGGHAHSISASGTHTHAITGVVPPFYALAFIMKV